LPPNQPLASRFISETTVSIGRRSRFRLVKYEQNGTMNRALELPKPNLAVAHAFGSLKPFMPEPSANSPPPNGGHHDRLLIFSVPLCLCEKTCFCHQINLSLLDLFLKRLYPLAVAHAFGS
ncbi:MAG: hypothetical protein ACKO0V_01985, partial [bacterium]